MHRAFLPQDLGCFAQPFQHAPVSKQLCADDASRWASASGHRAQPGQHGAERQRTNNVASQYTITSAGIRRIDDGP